ncbi:MAG: cardiolipin synthase ClsB [Betaproteobacteria bacterium]|nr:cardiolipin synthase ClsB [Betaproteobacteria bacterium]
MGSEFVPGNLVELLESGTDFFPLLRRSIDAARHEIFLETYIFENDDTGHMIAAALARAARRGVAVRVLVDGFGGRDFPRTLMPALLDSGAEVLIYRPEMGRLHMARHRLRRLHRKVTVIDARVAFVGGINIIDDMHTPGHTPPRYDYAVRVEGPLLASIHDSARKLWELVTWANFKRRYRLLQPLAPVTDWRGSMRAGFVVRDNLRHRRDIEDSYLQAIAQARDSILIANAYFLPGRRFRHALTEAASRGVSVTVLLQGRVEYVLLHYASQALYGALLDAGIRIFEYHRSFLHAKVAVVDEHWATVGSSNIDPFSLLLAREANVVIRDANFAGSLRASLQRAMGNGAAQLHPADWNARSAPQRLLRWLAYGLVRAMIGLAGYGGKH